MADRANDDTFAAEVLESLLPVLVEFYSEGCIPCKRISPVLAELEDQFAGKCKIVKVSVALSPLLVEKYAVMAAPTLVFFSNRRERDRIRGAATKETIVRKIEALVALQPAKA